MKIHFSAIPSIITDKQRFASIKRWIIFGQNLGHASMIKEMILNKYAKNSLYSIIKHSYKDVNSDMDKFCTELASSCLFSSSKVFVIDDYPDSCNKTWGNIMKDSDSNNILIITAKDLSAKGQLRKLSEGEKHIAVINCFKQSAGEISDYIAKRLSALNIKFDRTVPMFLTSILPHDHMIIEQELNKIFLIHKSNKNNTALSIDLLSRFNTLGSGELSLNHLSIAFIMMNRTRFLQELDKASYYKIDTILIIRVIQNLLYRLINLKNKVKTTDHNNILHIISTASPPFFGEMRTYAINILRDIPIKALRRSLFDLLQIERTYKESSSPEHQYRILSQYCCQHFHT